MDSFAKALCWGNGSFESALPTRGSIHLIGCPKMNTNPYNWRRVEQKVKHMLNHMSATRLEVCDNQRIVRHSRVIAWPIDSCSSSCQRIPCGLYYWLRISPHIVHHHINYVLHGTTCAICVLCTIGCASILCTQCVLQCVLHLASVSQPPNESDKYNP